MKELRRKKVKKPCSFAEALADLDDFSVPRKKPTTVKIYNQLKNCETGQYQVKPRKVYAGKKERPAKTNRQPCKLRIHFNS